MCKFVVADRNLLVAGIMIVVIKGDQDDLIIWT